MLLIIETHELEMYGALCFMDGIHDEMKLINRFLLYFERDFETIFERMKFLLKV